MKNLLPIFALLGYFVAIAGAQTSYTEGPNIDYPNRIAAVQFADAVGTSTWANTGWTRLTSVSVAMTNSLTSSTNTISVVRSEGVTEALAVVTGDGSSFRWSALNDMDVILRPGDSVSVSMTETNNGGGYIYLNMEL